MNLGLLAAVSLVLAPLQVAAADAPVCDHSAATLYASPDGRWTASVQEEVCSTGKGAAAGVFVSLAPAGAPDRAVRVLNVAVPR